MRVPGWLVMAPKSEWTLSEDRRFFNVPTRIRLWHPGFWVELVKFTWRNR